MSDPHYPGMPAAPSRPTVVTVSSYLLYFSTAASIISAVLSLTTVGAIREVYADLYDNTANSGMESIIVAASVVGVVINILFAAGLAILAIYNNRGKQGARITTWVVGGIFLCCNGFGLLGNALGSTFDFGSGSTDPNVPDQAEIQRRLNEELPGWYSPVTITMAVLTVLALLGALILLALPASNAFFRKQPAGWEPSVPGSAYPGYPSSGTPPYPTSPYQPGEPPLPPPPGSTPPSSPDGPPSAPPPVDR